MAFVETIELTVENKQAVKRRRQAMKAEVQLLKMTLEVRVVEETLEAMERAMAEVGDPSAVAHPRTRGRSGGSITMRDVGKVRALLERKRDKLSAMKARAKTLTREAHGRPLGRTVTTHRLHSAHHHVDCSEGQFARWSEDQRTMPVWVTTVQGRRWWWYLDRFWWDDQQLRRDEVRALVDGSDLERVQQHFARERVRADVFGKRPVRRG
jgi:hypothetical protein